MSKATRSAIAFDVGAGGLRACQLRRRGTRIGLIDALRGDWTTPVAQPSESGPVFDAARVARAVGQGRFSGHDVSLLLSPPAVSFFPLQLPRQVLAQPPERLETAIRWEVSRGVREPAESLEIRHWLLPSASAQTPNIMAVATSVAVARDCHSRLSSAGARLRRIDVTPCALARVLALREQPADELCAVLDLGARHTTLTMLISNVPIYVRELPLCGPAWTRAIAGALDISEEMAESVKRRVGIQPSEHAARAGGVMDLSDRELPRVIFNLLRESLDALSREIIDCFSYAYRGAPQLASSHLFLAGGGAKLVGLADYLQTVGGMPVSLLSSQSEEFVSVCHGLTFDPESAAALGGALLDVEHE
ncbi:MAG: pilus assembly protein PilM [Phycisphaerae bacterium]